ncbi:hypothetical protein J7M22_12505 [Candidatus Poribacteria bacterium]|nr:hypothetical protein [Candidatus Poribacteria bacterium]
MRKITWLLLLPLLLLPLLAWGAEDTWRYRAYEAEFWKRVDDKLREAKVERIAVLPFKSPPDIAEPGRYQRRIETGLIGLSGYRYIVLTRDPDEIEALMRNFAFEMSDLFDQRTVARLGKALGAQVIVSGELFKFPPAEIRLYLHLVHAETGRIIYEEILCLDPKRDYMLPLDRLHPMDSKGEMEQFRFWNSVRSLLRSEGIKRITVLPRGKEGMTEPERQFEMGLVRSADSQYHVIAHDPDRLSRILENLNLEISDLFDLDTVARIGKMLGTQAIVLVKKADSGVRVNILNVKTGRLIFTATGNPDKVGRYRWD